MTDASRTWTYAYSTTGTTQTTTVEGPLDQTLTVLTDTDIGRATAVTNAAGDTWSFQYDSDLRLTRVTQPEGDYAEMEYDARSNLVETTRVPKPGSPLSAIVTSVDYPDACGDGITPATCNKPLSATDAQGGVTDYDWDEDTGQLVSVTQAAPTSGAPRPQARIVYADLQARYLSGPSTYVNGSAISVPVEMSSCATGAGNSCDGAANEVLTSITYPSTAAPNNLLPSSRSRGSGAQPAMPRPSRRPTPPTAMSRRWTASGRDRGHHALPLRRRPPADRHGSGRIRTAPER